MVFSNHHHMCTWIHKKTCLQIYPYKCRQDLNICGYVCVPAVCSGEITDSAGVVLSPNWPEAYDKGQDCIWGIHVEEDKRIMLDIQVYVSTFPCAQFDPPPRPLPFDMHLIKLLQTLSLNRIITKPSSSPVLTRTLLPKLQTVP